MKGYLGKSLSRLQTRQSCQPIKRTLCQKCGKYLDSRPNLFVRVVVMAAVRYYEVQMIESVIVYLSKAEIRSSVLSGIFVCYTV